MTPFEKLIEFLVSMTAEPWALAKPLFLIGFLLYIAFAVIVVRQVKLMKQTLNGILELPLRLVAWIHLGIAVLVLIIALIVL